MKLEVLLSTMNMKESKNDFINKVNISSDAIIVNQIDKGTTFSEIVTIQGNRKVEFYTFSEKGVGLSRNNCLMRMSQDIGVMADDDMVYEDDYEETIINEFRSRPNADIILFNVPISSKESTGEKILISKNERVKYYNSLKYGTVNIAFRKEKVRKANISFSLMFGGGAKYGSGEDSIFIFEALKKGLRIETSTKTIARIYNSESTWFQGYNEKYFFDKGALFQALSGDVLSYLLILQFCFRKKNLYKGKYKFKEVFNFMLNGKNNFREL